MLIEKLTSKFIRIRHKGKYVSVSEELLLFMSKPVPIIWDNGGLFSLIRTERVRNMYQFITDLNQSPHITLVKSALFWWDDLETLERRTVEALFGQQGQDQTADKPKKGSQ